MRELNTAELECVSGGMMQCTPEEMGNAWGGITDTTSIGQDIINIYECLIEATSYMIERVATSFNLSMKVQGRGALVPRSWPCE